MNQRPIDSATWVIFLKNRMALCCGWDVWHWISGLVDSASPCWLSKVLRNNTYIHIKYDIDIQVMISNTEKHHESYICVYIYNTYIHACVLWSKKSTLKQQIAMKRMQAKQLSSRHQSAENGKHQHPPPRSNSSRQCPQPSQLMPTDKIARSKHNFELPYVSLFIK